jgi:hypothetical protein
MGIRARDRCCRTARKARSIDSIRHFGRHYRHAPCGTGGHPRTRHTRTVSGIFGATDSGSDQTAGGLLTGVPHGPAFFSGAAAYVLIRKARK